MKVKLTTVLESIEALKVLSSLPVKAKTSFRISRLVKQLDAHLETFQESRKSVIDRFQKEDEDEEGNKINVIPKENIEEYSKEITDLISEEVEIDVPVISLDDLGEIEIEAKHLSVLDWLITE